MIASAGAGTGYDHERMARHFKEAAKAGKKLAKAIRAARSVAYGLSVTMEEATRALHKMIEQSKVLSDKAIDYAYISQRPQILMGRSLRATPLRGHRPVNMSRMQHK